MLSFKSQDAFLITRSAYVLLLAQCFAQSPSKLAEPVTWGSPDHAYGKRRPVTAADRAAIQNYFSGYKKPIFSTNLSDPAELYGDWNLVSDDNHWGDYQSCRRPGNVEASNAGLRLRTLVATDCHHKWSTGYIRSKAKYSYGFFEATIRLPTSKARTTLSG
jgi:hypothetical protein